IAGGGNGGLQAFAPAADPRPRADHAGDHAPPPRRRAVTVVSVLVQSRARRTRCARRHRVAHPRVRDLLRAAARSRGREAHGRREDAGVGGGRVHRQRRGPHRLRQAFPDLARDAAGPVRPRLMARDRGGAARLARAVARAPRLRVRRAHPGPDRHVPGHLLRLGHALREAAARLSADGPLGPVPLDRRPGAKGRTTMAAFTLTPGLRLPIGQFTVRPTRAHAPRSDAAARKNTVLGNGTETTTLAAESSWMSVTVAT